ncbi:bacteriophage lambda tail assembly I family protein [Escherichia coli P0302293.7]|nr:bacteriophage lambda tail assembly I family protein [Escherichia coli P0302293.7]
MKTGAEAIRALATQLPAFRQKLNDGWYQVRIAGRDAAKPNYLPVLMSRWQMVP